MSAVGGYKKLNRFIKVVMCLYPSQISPENINEWTWKTITRWSSIRYKV